LGVLIGWTDLGDARSMERLHHEDSNYRTTGASFLPLRNLLAKGVHYVVRLTQLGMTSLMEVVELLGERVRLPTELDSVAQPPFSSGSLVGPRVFVFILRSLRRHTDAVTWLDRPFFEGASAGRRRNGCAGESRKHALTRPLASVSP
jgi:hypothetical protein